MQNTKIVISSSVIQIEMQKLYEGGVKVLYVVFKFNPFQCFNINKQSLDPSCTQNILKVKTTCYSSCPNQLKKKHLFYVTITSFISITVLHGIGNIPHKIPYIQSKCGENLEIICGILSAPQNIRMDMNNVMTLDISLNNIF